MLRDFDFGIDSNDGREPELDRAPLPLHLLVMILSYVSADLERVHSILYQLIVANPV